MSVPGITVVVVNWDLQNETTRCLQSLQHLDFPCRVVVVDNGSTDGSADYIADRFPQVQLIRLRENLGFGAGCNKAIARALADPECDFIFLLNNDVVVHPRAISEIVRVAQAHPQVGILGPKVYCRERPNTIWYAGAHMRWGVLSFAQPGRYQEDRGQFGQIREVDCVFGAAMLVRRDVFEQVGVFDERFFLYLEDIDFCLRARAAGFSLLFVPQSHVWHRGSGSTASDPALRRYYMAKSTAYFLRKHTSPLVSIPAIGIWTLRYLRDILADLAQGEPEVIRSCWLGLIRGLTEAGAP